MPRNGSGAYSAPASSWNPVVGGTLISAADWTTLLADLATAMTQSLSKDGQTTPTANINLGGFRLTNVAAGISAGDALMFGQTAAQVTSMNVVGGRLNTAQGTDVASAATVNLDAATGNLVDVTGATNITAITLSQGREAVVRFTGILTLTNGASLVLPGGANIITAAGDYAVFRGYAAGVVRCESYNRADGSQSVQTGVVQDYIGTAAPTGYVLASGRTIGNAASGGTERANADTVTLYTLLWNSMADAQAPVSTGRGGSAASDYAANKTITLPDLRGRVVAGKDDMGGTAANRLTTAVAGFLGTTLGISGGNQQMQSHQHDYGGAMNFLANAGGGQAVSFVAGSSVLTGPTATLTTGTGTGTGASQNVQPTYILNKIIKL